MAYVVTGNCVNCRYTDCVVVCPCDCFAEIQDPNMLVIDPVACVDCDACASACPVGAIFPDDDVPQDQLHFIALNADRYSEGMPVTEYLGPLETAGR